MAPEIPGPFFIIVEYSGKFAIIDYIQEVIFINME